MNSLKKTTTDRILNNLTKGLIYLGVLTSQVVFAQNPYKENGKWGLKDDNNKVLITAQYDSEFTFDGRKIIPVSLNGKTGFINSEGKTIIPFLYKNASFFGEGLAPVQLGKKWGFIDMTGKMVIKPQFNNARSFSEGLAPYAEGGKWTEGDYPYFEGGKWGYIDKTGKIVIKAEFDAVGSFSEGLAPAGMYSQSSTPLFGYINNTGKLVINHFFNYADEFSNGMALVIVGNESSNNQHFFIRKDNTKVFPPIMCDRIEGNGQTFKEKGKVKIYAYDDDFKQIEYYVNIKGEKVQ